MLPKPGHIRTYTEFTFEAAHRVEGVSPLHGHTFVVRMDFSGPPDPTFGWPVNLHEVNRSFKRVLKAIGQADGNGDGEGEGDLTLIPEIGIGSLENIAKWIWGMMKPHHPELLSIDLNRGFRGSVEGCVYYGTAEDMAS